MSFLKKISFYPTSLALRFKIAVARRLLHGRFRWHALDALGIPGHGVDLLRVDFPPALDTKSIWGHGQPPHPELAALLSANRGEQLARLSSCLATAADCRAWPAHEEPANAALSWRENLFLTPFDQVALHGMLRDVRPERYLEIGSGMSTRIAWQARRNGGFPMEIVSIDPEPRLAISALCDQVHRRRLEDMTDEFLQLVTPRTVVFFDGSHRAFPGSDVTIFFLNLLPRLPAGAIVHIHDIYLPADYPPALLNRFWSEQYLLAAYLLGGAHRLQVLLPCADLATQPAARAPLIAALGPDDLRSSSFWLRMT
ncbi:class I SAM-dependent methyltransferase [Horticoccus luteus]|uniref:Class I SAM-dependent methyltransferase n=1 Tax=Horticoccus luteus TaxID=2862869 RepID=A0A8F9TYT4_9BACT|nr:class I SAM-dependent methyltransferase [Horticoccus luteus]QYM80496.1 class I SAM-dependent methyltransferase [Horticoccus luteus]